MEICFVFFSGRGHLALSRAVNEPSKLGRHKPSMSFQVNLSCKVSRSRVASGNITCADQKVRWDTRGVSFYFVKRSAHWGCYICIEYGSKFFLRPTLVANVWPLTTPKANIWCVKLKTVKNMLNLKSKCPKRTQIQKHNTCKFVYVTHWSH